MIRGDGETEKAVCHIKAKDYMKFGQALGRILGDIIYISPIEEFTWSEASSHIISLEDRENRSIKVPSSLLRRQV